MNLLLAFVIFTGIALGGDPPSGVKFGEVQPDSPAAAGRPAGGRRHRHDRRPAVLRRSTRDRGPDGLRAHAGQTVVLGVRHPDGTTAGRHGHPPGPGRDRASTGAARDRHSHASLTQVGTINVSLVDAVDRSGAARRSTRCGLILVGLGDLVSAIVDDPTAPPPASGPVGIAVQLGDVFWNARPDLTLYMAGHPVGQPRRS